MYATAAAICNTRQFQGWRKYTAESPTRHQNCNNTTPVWRIFCSLPRTVCLCPQCSRTALPPGNTPAPCRFLCRFREPGKRMKTGKSKSLEVRPEVVCRCSDGRALSLRQFPTWSRKRKSWCHHCPKNPPYPWQILSQLPLVHDLDGHLHPGQQMGCELHLRRIFTQDIWNVMLVAKQRLREGFTEKIK